jgi:hypothetical protein
MELIVTDVAEVRRVLANWIAQAYSTEGQLAEGVAPSEWIADRFLEWWRSELESDLSDAEVAVSATRAALEQLGGWENQPLGDAMHELIHVDDALASLRAILGFSTEGDAA